MTDISDSIRDRLNAAELARDTLRAQLATIHAADTPAAKVTVQEAARVLLGDDYDSPMLETLDIYNNDYDVGQDVLKALRAIAGGHDE